MVSIVKAKNTLTGEWEPLVLGANGWSPVFALIPDNGRVVMRLITYTGGTGAIPTLVGYLGPEGITQNILEAVDIRGTAGDGAITWNSLQGKPAFIGAGASAAAARTAIGAGTSSFSGSYTDLTNIPPDPTMPTWDTLENKPAVIASGTTVAAVLTQLGLDNVNNTTDANKPVSTATQTALNGKAPLASPALSGTPTAPTAATTTDTTQLATTQFVYNVFQEIIGLGAAAIAKGVFNLNSADAGTFISVSGVGSDESTNNWPVSGIASATSCWYNVFTFGASNRKTQVAFWAFSGSYQNRIWIRHYYDSTWGAWSEIARMSDVTIAINTAVAASRNPVIQTAASAATLTPAFTSDVAQLTALASALTIANPSGTAVDGIGFVIRIKDNGTARALTWGSQYKSLSGSLPATTTAGKWIYIKCMWNASATRVDVLSVVNEA